MVTIETLPGGVRLITEAIPTVRSASLGIWVKGGSRVETAQESGAAHFIEHMLFKGTQRRSAADIARETDAIGGQINAYTTKESTCFYARVLDDHLAQALDILYDMVYHSAFAQEAVETERGVILEEIDMYEDTPDDLCGEKLFGVCPQRPVPAHPGPEGDLGQHDRGLFAGLPPAQLSGGKYRGLPGGELPPGGLGPAAPALFRPSARGGQGGGDGLVPPRLCGHQKAH